MSTQPNPVERYHNLLASTQPRYASVEEAREQIVLGDRNYQPFAVARPGEFRRYRIIRTRDVQNPTTVVEDNPLPYHDLVEARRKAVSYIGEQVLSLHIPELPEISHGTNEPDTDGPGI